jgi:hypothetical protein
MRRISRQWLCQGWTSLRITSRLYLGVRLSYGIEERTLNRVSTSSNEPKRRRKPSAVKSLRRLVSCWALARRKPRSKKPFAVSRPCSTAHPIARLIGPVVIWTLMTGLRDVEVDVVTFGQYMRPTKKHMKVDRYVEPAEFDVWRTVAENMGFLYVASGPLVRSSYKAGFFRLLKVCTICSSRKIPMSSRQESSSCTTSLNSEGKQQPKWMLAGWSPPVKARFSWTLTRTNSSCALI